MNFGGRFVIPFFLYVCMCVCGNTGSNGNNNSEYFEEVQRNVMALHRVLQVNSVCMYVLYVCVSAFCRHCRLLVWHFANVINTLENRHYCLQSSFKTCSSEYFHF